MATKKPVSKKESIEDDWPPFDPEQAAYEYELDHGHKKIEVENDPNYVAGTPAYDADQLISLSPIAHIRKRPNLSLGSFTFMQNTAAREVLDNATDEIRAGYGSSVKLTIHEDGAASIEDDGRGVPVGINKRTGENGIFMAFGKVGSGGKFGAADSGYAGSASSGLNGVGTTATNATSRRFDTTVYRDGKIHRLSFKEGEPGHFSGENGPDDVFKKSMDIVVSKDTRSAAEKKARPTGTTIKFWPDPVIFGNDSVYRIGMLRDSLRATAFLVPGIRIEIDDRLGEREYSDENGESRLETAPQHDIYQFEGGIVEMLDLVSPDSKLLNTVHLQGEDFFIQKVPVPQQDGTVKEENVNRKVTVDVAVRWGNGYEYSPFSYVNTVNTYLHGTHLTGFERALSKVLLDNVKNTRGLLKAKDEVPIADDVKEGLTAVLSITQPEPNFVGQEKARLGGVETQKIVNSVVTEKLKEWIDNKKNASALKIIQQKIIEAAKVRATQRQDKETARKTSALGTSSMMPSKLVACGEKDNRYTELQICEGDSALGGLMLSRDARYQAIYPLKGKPKNVYDQNLSTALDNQEISDMVKIIGAGVGRSFDIEQMRYKRIIMLADADSDGSHIRVLLVGFFYRFMRPLVEAGRLYAAMPPLFSVTTTGKNKEKFYALNNDELEVLLKDLDKKGKKYEKPQRHKGLGEYSEECLSAEVMNPETRTLRRISIHEAELASQMLDLTLGKDPKGPEKRRQWILDERTLVSEIDA